MHTLTRRPDKTTHRPPLPQANWPVIDWWLVTHPQVP